MTSKSKGKAKLSSKSHGKAKSSSKSHSGGKAKSSTKILSGTKILSCAGKYVDRKYVELPLEKSLYPILCCRCFQDKELKEIVARREFTSWLEDCNDCNFCAGPVPALSWAGSMFSKLLSVCRDCSIKKKICQYCRRDFSICPQIEIKKAILYQPVEPSLPKYNLRSSSKPLKLYAGPDEFRRFEVVIEKPSRMYNVYMDEDVLTEVEEINDTDDMFPSGYLIAKSLACEQKKWLVVNFMSTNTSLCLKEEANAIKTLRDIVFWEVDIHSPDGKKLCKIVNSSSIPCIFLMNPFTSCAPLQITSQVNPEELKQYFVDFMKRNGSPGIR